MLVLVSPDIMTSQSKQRQILLIQYPTSEHTGAPAQGTGIFRTFCRTELQEIPVTSDLVQLDGDKREPDLGLMFCSLDPYQKGYIDKVARLSTSPRTVCK